MNKIDLKNMKIILNTATHGNERIGLKVAKKIEKLNIDKNILNIQIANKKALSLHKRFIDQDLNRSFPGKKHGNYEEKLAYKLSPVIKTADLVIDIHSTTSELKDALIVTKLDSKTLEYVKAIKPKRVLVMNATKSNSLISQAKIGIAFEYGRDNSQATINSIVVGISRLFNHLGLVDITPPKTKAITSYFNVTSAVQKPKGYKLLKNIKNYKIVYKNEAYASNGKDYLVANKNFYPILFGEKKYKDIFGFLAVKYKKT